MADLYSIGDSFDNSIDTFGTRVSVQLLNEIDPVKLTTKRSPRFYDVQLTSAAPIGTSEVVIDALPAGLDTIPVGSSLVYDDGSDDHMIKIEEKGESANLTLDTSALPIEFPATTNLRLYPFYRLLGGNNIDLKMNDKEVETRAFESGIWSDAKKVMAGAVGNWGGFYPKDDEALNKVILPAAKSSQELFVEIMYPNGMSRYGSAYLQGYGDSAKNDDVVQAAWAFRFVTEIFFRDAKGNII